MRHRLIGLAAIALAPLPLSACWPLVQACTEIGCANEVILTVTDAQGARVTAFHGTVEISGQTMAVSCPSSGGASTFLCLDGELRIESAAPPATVRVDLQSQDGSSSFAGDVALDRQTFRPNGPDCEPECTSAKATVPLG